MTESTRRDFMITGAAAAATVMASGGVFAKGDDTIKIGVVGCGGRGSGAAKDCLTADAKVKLVAVADVFENKVDNTVRNLEKQFKDRIDVPKERRFVGLDAYEKVINSGIDLVILATPPGFRPLHLEAAVKAKKHIFTEKPVAVDAAGIQKCLHLVEESKKSNLAIVAGTQRRHQAGYIETIKRIHDGAIGEIVTARCYWNNNGIWFHDRKDGASDVAYQLDNWYHFLWVCGDHIVEQHVHNLDVINWIMKAHPISARGMGGRGPGRKQGDPNVVGNIFDHFSVEYTYPNGVKMFSFCRHQKGWNEVAEAVHGTKGFSKVDDYIINNQKIGKFPGEAPYVQEHIDLIESIRSGKPLNELQAVTESTMTAILGRMSAYSGQELTWEQALNSNQDTFPKNLTWESRLPVDPVPVPGETRFI